MTDPIADMLTRIRNGYMARLKQVEIPYSKMKESLAAKFEQLNYVAKVDVVGEGKQKKIVVKLKYKNKISVITGLKRISTPGRRNYVSAKDIKPTLSGYGVSILTTNKGILSDKEARQAGVGGEIVCQVW